MRQEILVSALLLGACHGSTSTTPNNPAVTEDKLHDSITHAVCDNIASCCQAAGYAFNASGCASYFGMQVNQLLADGADAGLTYNAQTAGDCVAWAQQVSSTCGRVDDNSAGAQACSSIFAGTAKVGQPCDHGACAPPADGNGIVECVSWGSGSFDGGPPQSGSLCQQRVPAKAGDPCGQTTVPPPSVVSDCSSATSNFKCDPQSHTCQPRAAIGQPCSLGQTRDCVAGAYCSGSTCAATKADGQPCQSGSECSGGRCTKGACATESIADVHICTGQ